MSATYARAQGFQRDGSPQQGQRTAQGHGSAVASVATYETFATVAIHGDGAGEFTLKDGAGRTVYEHRWEKEADR